MQPRITGHHQGQHPLDGSTFWRFVGFDQHDEPFTLETQSFPGEVEYVEFSEQLEDDEPVLIAIGEYIEANGLAVPSSR
jgi:hypothetical protein